MDTTAILAALLSERDRLNQAIAALESLGGTSSTSSKPGRKPAAAIVPTAPKKRVLSAASRNKMAEAAKKRWAVKKAAEKKPAAKAPAAKKAAPVASAAIKGARKPMSAATKKKLAAAAKARWAAKKAPSKKTAKKTAAPVATAAVKEAAKA
jgi:hypothetical protein